jgi:predicted transcriptional regulator
MKQRAVNSKQHSEPQEIVRALEARGMTHHQIAKSIGVTQSSIWRIAAGITTGPKYWVMDSLRLLLEGKV